MPDPNRMRNVVSAPAYILARPAAARPARISATRKTVRNRKGESVVGQAGGYGSEQDRRIGERPDGRSVGDRGCLRRVRGCMAGWQDSMGEPRQDHGAQESLEQYCNNACVERVMDAIEQG